MANYSSYVGQGGIANGTQFPAGGTVQVGEVVVAQTAVPDNREGIQGGVMLTGFIDLGTSTNGLGTVLFRQSTLGTSAVTGNALGTFFIPVGTGNQTTIGPYTFQCLDLTGTFPIPSYQLTLTFASGTGTVFKSYLTAQVIGQ